jgi:5-enolpyruvylshikimate-3-phosphate synthase
VVIRNQGCVVKSFPDFWQKLDGVRIGGAAA